MAKNKADLYFLQNPHRADDIIEGNHPKREDREASAAIKKLAQERNISRTEAKRIYYKGK